MADETKSNDNNQVTTPPNDPKNNQTTTPTNDPKNNQTTNQPNDPKNNQTHNHLLPPLSWPDKDPDPHDPYDYITTDVPTEQTILIYLNHAQAGYLPHAATVDESGHIVPADIYNRQTRSRVLPIAVIRQGEASGVNFRFQVFDETGRANISDFYKPRFQGRTSQNNFISTDKGFETTQASIGQLDWTPEEAVGLVAGKFVSAQIVLERQDGTTRSISLDFDLHVIPNDVAFPRPMAFYISEYQRCLANFKKMQDLADEHIGYTLDFFDHVITDALIEYKKHIDAALQDFQNKLDTENSNFDALDTKFQALKKAEEDLANQITEKGLLTKGDFVPIFTESIANGSITTEDQISDQDVAATIEAWDSGSEDIIPSAKTIDVSNLTPDSATITGGDNV